MPDILTCNSGAQIALRRPRPIASLPVLAVIIAGVVAIAPAAAHAQAARRAQGFGLGLGAGTIANGLSMKYYMGGAALQGVVGVFGGGDVGDRFRHFNGIAGSLDYLFEMPSLARSQYFTVDWSFGLGAGFGVQAFSSGSPALAGSGIAGIEFNFTTFPLDLVIEYRPSLGILPDPGLNLVNFTAHIRIYFW
jgi:hypothetical protein